jgi:predicted transcriptional regulator
VALHAGLAAVVFTSGMTPDQAVRAKAEQEKLPLFTTAQSTFDAAGRLYAMGLRGAGSRRA